MTAGQPIWMSEIFCENTYSYTYSFWPLKLTMCRFWGMEDVNCTYGMVGGVQCSMVNAFPPASFECGSLGRHIGGRGSFPCQLRGGAAGPNLQNLASCRVGYRSFSSHLRGGGGFEGPEASTPLQALSSASR